MAQRSISSFFFKGAASVGAGAPATVVAADPTSPPAVANDAETADAPEIETRKRKRESGDEGTARDETPGTGTPGRSDDHGVSATGASVSPETRAEILAVTAERDPRRRDAMRERLGENAVGSSESKRREVRERFKWLDAKHVVDDKGRHPSHEDYDGNTVRVPSHLKLSASQKQYWDVKSKFRDVVLFFKVGKFYELYEDDAEIGCAALDWKMTVSGVGHCRQVGCPESGVDAAIAELVRRGHKVGRIEQMETAAEAKARTGSKTAVIRRELLEVTSPATAVDGDGSSRGGQSGVRPAHLMAIAPSAIAERGDGDAKASATVGFAFLDAAAGTLRVGSFADDAGSVSRGAQSHIALSTLLTQTSPVEVLVRRGDGGRTEARVRAALANGDPSAAPRVTSVASDADEGGPEGYFFPARARDADAALARFFLRDEKNDETRTTQNTQSDKSDKSRHKSVLAFVATQPAETRCAVAALAAHLTRLRCAAPLLAAEAATHAVYAPGETARLDGPTVRHLELLCGPDGTLQGSVLGELDTCVTPAGSRTLRRWLAAPLTSPARVAERQRAVAFFGGFADDFGSAEGTDERDDDTDTFGEVGADNCGRLRRALRRVPDLERCVGRARAASAAKTADPRALPEPLAEKRHKRRVAALAAAVAAADAVVAALRDVANIADFQTRAPELVKASVRTAHPETLGFGASDALEEARAALDWGSAGDDAGSTKTKTASRTAAAAAPALKSTRARLGDASPDLSMDVLAACEREVDALLERFLEHAPRWGALATAAARLDALAALAAFGANAAGPTCRPAFVRRAEDAAPTFHARALWNPCAVESLQSAGSSRARTGGVGGSGAVPNDLDLGGFKKNDASGSETSLPPAVLLTGPNMGGKSTLLRAACVAVVLAQVGAPVPCASLTLSPADVVFTRLGGASDRLDAGESTFLVECAEAASILRGASRDSFVVLDELGRGTSTFDGYAVAHAALHALVVRTKCRLLFATHYHALSRAFGATPAVALRHMAARVGAEHLGDRSIAFLYALRPGACPKSYGTNVAALAGVPESVLDRATQAAAAMERKLAGAFAIGSKDGGKRDDARALRRALAARDSEALGEAWASLR